MISYTVFIAHSLIVLALLTSDAALSAESLKPDDIVLVANKANTLDELKQSQLVRIYLRKTKRFTNGDHVIPVDLQAGDTRDLFYKEMIRRTERQLKYYWSRMMFSGNTRPPKKLLSDTAVINFVANNVSALGYVRAESVTDDVKIIEILDK